MVRGCAFEPEDVVPLTGFILAMWPVDWSDSEGSVHTAEIETQLKTDTLCFPRIGPSHDTGIAATGAIACD